MFSRERGVVRSHLRIAVALLGVVGLLLLSTAGIAVARPIDNRIAPTPPGIFQFVVGTEFLAGYDPTWDPAVSSSPRGELVHLRGYGLFNTATGDVSGDGTYVHLDAAGVVVSKGWWRATEFLSFRSYGSASAQGWPENFYGGTAKVVVDLIPEGGGASRTATLQIDSALGSAPPGRDTGIRLQPDGGPNFLRRMGGGTLFIRL